MATLAPDFTTATRNAEHCAHIGDDAGWEYWWEQALILADHYEREGIPLTQDEMKRGSSCRNAYDAPHEAKQPATKPTVSNAGDSSTQS